MTIIAGNRIKKKKVNRNIKILLFFIKIVKIRRLFCSGLLCFVMFCTALHCYRLIFVSIGILCPMKRTEIVQARTKTKMVDFDPRSKREKKKKKD